MTSTAALVWGGLAVFDLALALLLLGVRPRRLINLVMGAVFASNTLVALVFAAGEAALIAPDRVPWWSLFVDMVGFNLLPIIPLIFPRRRLRPTHERAAFALAGGVAIVSWAALLAAPSAFVPQPGPDGRLLPSAVFFALTLPGYLGIVGGVVLFLDSYVGSPNRILREQAGFFLAAYALKAVVLLRFGPSALLGPFATLRDWAQPALWLVVLSIPLALLAARLRRRADAERPDLETSALVLGVTAFGGVIALGRLPSDWAIELVRGVLFSYGILKFQALDVDLRQHRGLIAAAVIVGCGLTFIIAQNLLASAGVDPSVAGGVSLMAALTAGGGIFYSVAGRVGMLPGAGSGTPATRDAYIAALAAASADGSGHSESNGRILKALRSRLGVSEREHAVLEAEMRVANGGGRGAPAVGARFLGRYRVESLLGEGGFGRAYLAVDQTVGRRVVLKVAHGARDEDLRRTLREARILARLGHPNIVGLHDVEEVGDDVILVLEFVGGGSLAGRLARGPLPLPEARRIFDDVLSALEVAHAEGVIHRDVKPANILLTEQGRAKLADFGVARAPKGSGTVSGVSVEAATPGTVRYMSPEQVLGKPLDARSDLYAVGVVLYEALAGRPYLDFENKAEFEARMTILQNDPWLPLPDLPDDLNRLLAQALAKDPAMRPPSVAELRRRLAAVPPTPR